MMRVLVFICPVVVAMSIVKRSIFDFKEVEELLDDCLPCFHASKDMVACVEKYCERHEEDSNGMVPAPPTTTRNPAIPNEPDYACIFYGEIYRRRQTFRLHGYSCICLQNNIIACTVKRYCIYVYECPNDWYRVQTSFS